MPWRAAKSATMRGLTGQQSGGCADIEPLGKESRGGDAAHGFVEARKLLLRRYAVSLVGGEEMRHDAFEAKRRAGLEAREDCGELAGPDALAAHAGVDFKMDGHGARLRARSASSGEISSSSCQGSHATGVS